MKEVNTMKKVLALVLSLVLMLGTATTAFAASEPEQHSYYMTATAYSYGSFDYGIPETTNFDKYGGNLGQVHFPLYEILKEEAGIE